MDGFSIMLLGVLAFVILLGWVGVYNNKQEHERREKYAGLSSSDLIAFHYCDADSASGVTRQTVRRVAEQLGMNESEVIHQALYELAARNAVLNRQA
jgi:hypothetical protein